MKKSLSLLVLAAVIAFVSIAYAEDGFEVLSSNAKYTLKGKAKGGAYQLTPLAPMKIKVKGPGTLELTFYKNYMPRDSRKKLRIKAVVGIYLGTNKIKDAYVKAAKVKGLLYAERGVKFRPGKGKTVKVEIPEGDQEVNLVVSPAAEHGVGVAIKFVPPAPDVVPIVPIVPLAPVEEEKPAKQAQASNNAKSEVPVVPIVPLEPEKPKKKPVKKAQKKQEKAKPVAKQPKKKPESKKKEQQKKVVKNPAKPIKKESPKKEEEAKSPQEEIHYVRIMPFAGLNMPLRTGQGFIATYSAGLDLHYILPISAIKDRLSMGLAFAYSGYGYTVENVPIAPNSSVTVDVDLDMKSMYLLFDTQFDFYKTDLLVFYADLGLGLLLGSATYTPHKSDRVLYGHEWSNFKTFGMQFGSGVLFRLGKAIWAKDFFDAGLGISYRMAQITYKDENGTEIIKDADHGGLALELMLRFQF